MENKNKIFIVVNEWRIDGVSGMEVEVFDTFDKAKEYMENDSTEWEVSESHGWLKETSDDAVEIFCPGDEIGNRIQWRIFKK